MQCYKRIDSIAAISFDLDDTLYDNGPIIQASEGAQLDYLHRAVERTQNTDVAFWQQNQREYAKQHPNAIHDMANFRLQSIYYGLLKLALPDKDAHVHASGAYEAFYKRRIKVSLDGPTLDLLAKLKARYRLIALTNGTASIDKMGLGEVFEFAIHGGQEGMRQKPAKDMYHAACERLGIQSKNLLHVGDSLSHDVKGALASGCTAAWLNLTGFPMGKHSALPHIELSSIHQLEKLL